jgi:hypothetical protein
VHELIASKRAQIDVVSATAIRNPYFRSEVMRTREPLYAA